MHELCNDLYINNFHMLIKNEYLRMDPLHCFWLYEREILTS